MALLADHEDFWELNRQLPALWLGAWILVAAFGVCRWAVGRPGIAWHTSVAGRLAYAAMAAVVVLVIAGSMPRHDDLSDSTCGPALYEWNVANSNCPEALRPLRITMVTATALFVVLVVATRRRSAPERDGADRAAAGMPGPGAGRAR